jgi:hypothetical protein
MIEYIYAKDKSISTSHVTLAYVGGIGHEAPKMTIGTHP